ncbi:MAG: hypothetical protein L3J74_01910 [Bacteroidales bacterium]|nr:hypothetical protein [Bacteroidales bacterium]
MRNLLIIVFIFIAFSVSAQKHTSKDSIPNYENSTLFNSDELLNFDLKVNKKSLFADVGEKRSYHKAKVYYSDTSGDTVKLKIKVQTRGNFRRNPDNCKFPPLKFKIPKKVRWGNNIFSGQARLKLVVPCFSKNDNYQELVIKEYLVYKMYNLFTDYSYRVRLAHINLIDSAENKKLFDFYGFFIEETGQMAKRNNGKVLKLNNFRQQSMNQEQMTELAVFQYMISNTDWALSKLHNVKLLFVNNNPVPIAVPYDFDWSGFVNAPYAVPSPKIGTNHVRQRVYRGYERPIDELNLIFEEFNEKKDRIYNLINNDIYLSVKTKQDLIKFLSGFYKTINNQEEIKSVFVKNARK